MQERSWKQVTFDGFVTTLRYGAIVLCVFLVSAAIVISVSLRTLSDVASADLVLGAMDRFKTMQEEAQAYEIARVREVRGRVGSETPLRYCITEDYSRIDMGEDYPRIDLD